MSLIQPMFDQIANESKAPSTWPAAAVREDAYFLASTAHMAAIRYAFPARPHNLAGMDENEIEKITADLSSVAMLCLRASVMLLVLRRRAHAHFNFGTPISMMNMEQVKAYTEGQQAQGRQWREEIIDRMMPVISPIISEGAEGEPQANLVSFYTRMVERAGGTISSLPSLLGSAPKGFFANMFTSKDTHAARDGDLGNAMFELAQIAAAQVAAIAVYSVAH